MIKQSTRSGQAEVGRAPETEVHQPAQLSEEMLRRKTTTKETLKEFCRQRGMPDDGTKDKLVRRLLGEAEDQYTFGTKVRCPRCGSLNTRAYSTKGNVQYRECLMAVCRNRFAVRGEKI